MSEIANVYDILVSRVKKGDYKQFGIVWDPDRQDIVVLKTHFPLPRGNDKEVPQSLKN